MKHIIKLRLKVVLDRLALILYLGAQFHEKRKKNEFYFHEDDRPEPPDPRIEKMTHEELEEAIKKEIKHWNSLTEEEKEREAYQEAYESWVRRNEYYEKLEKEKNRVKNFKIKKARKKKLLKRQKLRIDKV